MKTIKFYTLGCKVNQYDTQLIREQFIRAGFKELDNGLPADVYVVNTCTVTHRADKDSLKFIRKAEKENPYADILVTGCLAELDEVKISNSNNKITLVKNKHKESILSYINPLFVQAKYKQDSKHDCAGISYFTGHTRAFLKIQDGCDNFCSYCKVPYVRGSPRSKAISEIVIEAEKLVESGFKEVVLCGVCLGAYGKDLVPQSNLVSVIKRLEEISGLLRIRLSSIEPKDVNDALIKELQSSDKLCPHLHIPLQSGDDDVLKAMNRNYARTEYLNLVNKIRKFIPDIAITT
ncbi:MAG: MiaB/RimO family radical SAM methylthiotransferase, partial [Candidatus Omnitrophota bacterium]